MPNAALAPDAVGTTALPLPLGPDTNLPKTRTVDSLARAARSFISFQEESGSKNLDGWCCEHEGEPAHAELFREAHRSGPEHANRLARALTSMPAVGDKFLNFRLLAELGRGAFGRVFLAEQSDLAGRRVALKISTNLFNETQTLAQLQHTNIVPIYSAHYAEPFQALCMPYLGSLTLADVLQSVAHRGAPPASGRELVSTLNFRRQRTTRTRDSISGHSAPRPPSEADGAVPVPDGLLQATALVPEAASPPNQPAAALAWKEIQDLTYVQTVNWLGVRLADGLAHAHEHGIIHRDLKPANILLADDGQPLLLDFNIADNHALRSTATGASVGGTLPYMAPEHLESFRNPRRHADARSDIYALGLILYELLTGKTAFPCYRGPLKEILPVMISDRKKLRLRVRKWNRAVSPAVESIILHCLEPEPAKRYQSARELQEDLDRQLHSRPLRFAHEPSPRERLQKWTRRHPRLTSSTSVAVFAIVLITGLALGLVVRGQRLARFQALDQFAQFRDEMNDSQFLLYGPNPDREKLTRGVETCRQALGRYAVLDDSAWQELPAVVNLPPEERGRLKEDIGETLFLAARATFARAVYEPERPRQQELLLAMELNRSAESCYDSDRVPTALWKQRAELLEREGKIEQAAEAARKAKVTPPRTARDFYLLAHLHAVRGNFREALPLLAESVQRDPRSLPAWLVKGNCHYALSRYTDAAACYSTCIALRPQLHSGWFNRGLAHLGLGDYARAVADFDEALALKAAFADGFCNRGLAYQGWGRHDEAIRDFTRALALGTPRTQVYFMRALSYERKGDRPAAARDRAAGMKLTPNDEQSWVARGQARIARDPKAALADFGEALKINPRSYPALQNIAHVWADVLRDDRQAVRVLDKEVRFFPDNHMARAGRGVSRARLGLREQAVADAEQALLLDVSAQNLYQVACIYALTSRHSPQDRLRAFQLLSYGLKGGFGLDIVDSDTDLDPIRNTAEFRRMVAAARELQANGKR